ncbi:ExbD/TolR family protein [Aliiroseovarius sp. PTFE2010]|uniref:ExbD/TolR family protein n=1 Tax=Aliiroseovarius sp. PTFE2010 TaxID=3417190 RepID=UPI003CF95A9B
MFSFASPQPRRKPSLTPMIDVVFLLLVFFMLASQFGQDKALPLTAAGSRTAYTGPPRLIDIGQDDLRLNGSAVSMESMIDALRPLVEADDDVIILRGADDAPLQRLIDVAQALQAAGFTQLALIE